MGAQLIKKKRETHLLSMSIRDAGIQSDGPYSCTPRLSVLQTPGSGRRAAGGWTSSVRKLLR